ATETQLKGEAEPITDLTYTPGSPFGVRVGVYYKFSAECRMYTFYIRHYTKHSTYSISAFNL
ncbi:hypothetical protein, partial [Chryseobacterium sp. SIMBA_029]|uniref:hypothetical protein n=1 Tax=Chryseobacterium sp. SIMBA_029 TaxID=3085772 RepID=UPI003978F153